MKKAEMIELLQSSVEQKPLLRLFLKYDAYYTYWFLFGASKKLLLGAKEDDFIIDGFSIRRISDIKKVEFKDDKCVEILKAEKVLDRICAPEIDLTDWHSAFLSLQKLEKNIIIKHESLEETARRLRYGCFDRITSGGAKIATAHTANDNAETVLMNIIRGTGTKGLAGIPPVRGSFIRPLIFCTREDTEEYCRENGIELL